MKISDTEYTKVVELNSLAPILDGQPTAPPAIDHSADAEIIADTVRSLEDMPEVREEVVADLKARIEAGKYQVSSDMIAELMIRRAKADSLE